MYPSFLAHVITGLLILYVIVMILYRMKEPNSLGNHYQEYMIVLMLAIAIGIHGFMHAYAEVNYGFNPLNSQWGYSLKK